MCGSPILPAANLSAGKAKGTGPLLSKAVPVWPPSPREDSAGVPDISESNTPSFLQGNFILGNPNYSQSGAHTRTRSAAGGGGSRAGAWVKLRALPPPQGGVPTAGLLCSRPSAIREVPREGPVLPVPSLPRMANEPLSLCLPSQ